MRALRLNFCQTGATGLWISWGLVLLLIVVTLAVFWLVPSHEFVLWDDNKTVYDNPALRSFTLDHLLRFWRAPHMELYIPCTYMLWAVTAAVSRWVTPQPTSGAPLDPQLFHSLNLLVHLVNVLVVSFAAVSFNFFRSGMQQACPEGPLIGCLPCGDSLTPWVPLSNYVFQ